MSETIAGEPDVTVSPRCVAFVGLGAMGFPIAGDRWDGSSLMAGLERRAGPKTDAE